MAGVCVAATDTFSCAGRTALPLGGAAVCVDQALEGGTSAASTTFSNTSSILDFSQVPGARMPQLNFSPYILNPNEILSTPGVRGA